MIVLGSGCAKIQSLLPSKNDDVRLFQRLPVIDLFSIKSENIVSVQITVPLDLLWMVDNSGSMDSSQAKIAAGFSAFATKYLQAAGTDIRLAVITSDTYLAGMGYLSSGSYGPNNGADFARMFPGIHDGLRPPVGSGVRTGKPILATKPPAGVAADNAWFDKLNADFAINARPGINGRGDERGVQSIVRFLDKNEKRAECAATPQASDCFFRPKIMRGIVMVSDEDDASRFDGATTMSAAMAAGKAKLDTFFRNLDGSGSGGSANYFVTSIVNPVWRYDDTLPTVTQCIPQKCTGDVVVDAANDIVTFNPVAQNGAACESTNGNQSSVCRWGKQYIEFVNQMKADTVNTAAKYSSIADIGSSNYDTILDSIGQSIVDSTHSTTKGLQFTLSSVPENSSDIIVNVVHADGSKDQMPVSNVSLSGQVVTITAPGFPDALLVSDKLEIIYFPAMPTAI